MTAKFIELAGEVNVQMPHYVVEKLQYALNERGKAVKGSRILVLGLAYKKDVDDARESPAFEIIDALLRRGAVVSYHDPHVPRAPRTRAWPELASLSSETLTPELLAAQDAVVIVTDHSAVDYDLVLRHAPLIVDSRGVYRQADAERRQGLGFGIRRERRTIADTGLSRPAGSSSRGRRDSSARTWSTPSSRAAPRCARSTTSSAAGARTSRTHLAKIEFRRRRHSRCRDVPPAPARARRTCSTRRRSGRFRAPSPIRPTTFAVNVAGTANVFAAARDEGVRRVVYASSSSVYGDSEALPKREGEEGRPLSPYALSKRMNEELAELFARCFGMELIGLRYFNVYGPRQDPEGPYAAVLPRFFKAVFGRGGSGHLRRRRAEPRLHLRLRRGRRQPAGGRSRARRRAAAPTTSPGAVGRRSTSWRGRPRGRRRGARTELRGTPGRETSGTRSPTALSRERVLGYRAERSSCPRASQWRADTMRRRWAAKSVGRGRARLRDQADRGRIGMSAAAEPKHEQARFPSIIIEPTRGWTSLQLKEVWAYRELLYFLVWRDVKVRYKQTVLGVAWAVLQPLVTTVVFTIFFGRLAGVGSDGLPYPLFSFAGLLPWNLFAQGLSQSVGEPRGLVQPHQQGLFPAARHPDLVGPRRARRLLRGVRDPPRDSWPTTTSGLPPRFLLLPFFVLLAAGAALGVGLWLSALNVKYRDVRYVVPFFVQLWLFVTPVIYPASLVAAKLEASGHSCLGLRLEPDGGGRGGVPVGGARNGQRGPLR